MARERGTHAPRRVPAMRRCLAAVCALCCASAQQQRWELPIPRVTVDELEANATLRSGLHAYVLKGFVGDKWRASNWTLEYLRKKIPFEWVDYYPENMADEGKKPFLVKFDKAVDDFGQPSKAPKYMQIRLGLRGWNRLKKDFSPKPLPDVFWDDDGWIDRCMRKDGKADVRAIDNFFVTNQWKFLLVGQKGTTMFFHQDGTAASSWQAQVVGRKKWTLCPHSETRLLSLKINTHDPDYSRFPAFAKALCGQVTVSPGELLYYPAYWWHHTLQLDTPSIAYTGALVGIESERDDLGSERRPHAQFLKDLLGKCDKCWKRGQEKRTCDDISEKWPGAAPPPLRVVCDTYLHACFEKWDEHVRSLRVGAPPGTFKTDEL